MFFGLCFVSVELVVKFLKYYRYYFEETTMHMKDNDNDVTLIELEFFLNFLFCD